MDLKFRKIKLNGIQRFLSKLLKMFGEKPFLTSLGLILISLIIGGLVFYKYSILAENKKPEAQSSALILDEQTLQKILNTWQERQNEFEQTQTKEYPNPFK